MTITFNWMCIFPESQTQTEKIVSKIFVAKFNLMQLFNKLLLFWKRERMTRTFQSQAKSRWTRGLGWRESLPSVTRLTVYRTAVRSISIVFILNLKRLHFSEFDLSFVTGLWQQCQPFKEKYCLPQIVFLNVKMSIARFFLKEGATRFCNRIFEIELHPKKPRIFCKFWLLM